MTVTLREGQVRVADDATSARTPRWPGLLAAALGLGGAMLAHRFVPAIGVLTWAVALGMVAGNTGMLRGAAKQGLTLVTRRLLRIGIVCWAARSPSARSRHWAWAPSVSSSSPWERRWS